MKPFDLKAALAGAPVVTVSGEPVTGLHFFDGLSAGAQSLCGVLTGRIESWHEDGFYYVDKWPCEIDLRMADDNQAHDQGE